MKEFFTNQLAQIAKDEEQLFAQINALRGAKALAELALKELEKAEDQVEDAKVSNKPKK